jgi:putative ABC transport system substrate-binding protein
MNTNRQVQFTIGLLHYVSKDDPFFSNMQMRRMREELTRMGYVQGENTDYIEAYGDSDLELTKRRARELVEAGANVIISFIAKANLAAQVATAASRTPVICWSSFPLQEGLADSYQRPGRNFTGFTYDPYVQLAKMRFLKLVRPGLRRIGYLHNDTYSVARHTLPEIRSASELFGVELMVTEVHEIEECEGALGSMKKDGCEAVIVGPHELFWVNGEWIGSLLLEMALPATCNQESIVRSGALAQYGAPGAKGWSHMPSVVDRVLRGEDISNIPFDRSVKHTMVLSLRNAAVLGLEVPQMLIDEADLILE